MKILMLTLPFMVWDHLISSLPRYSNTFMYKYVLSMYYADISMYLICTAMY